MSVTTLLAWMYVGGHVQNDTTFEGFIAQPLIPIRDELTGQICRGDVCQDECGWWSWEDSVDDSTEKRTGNQNAATKMELDELDKLDKYCGGAWSIRSGSIKEALRQATERAVHCMTRELETCMLSHEVDLPIPGIVTWNATNQDTKLFLLPRILEKVGHLQRVIQNKPGLRASDLPFKRVVVKDMYDAVRVQYYDQWTHETLTEVVYGDVSYCLQLLAHSIPPDCEKAPFSLLSAHDGRM